MQNLIKFLLKHHIVILFILLEIISFSFIVGSNNTKKAKYLGVANIISSYLYENFNIFSEYVSLKQQNEKLIAENTKIKDSLDLFKNSKSNELILINNNYKITIKPEDTIQRSINPTKEIITDTGIIKQYSFIGASVSNDSLLKYHHIDAGFINIDKTRQFFYTPAKVINNSVDKRNNYITLNKGKNHGIEPDMAVISSEGEGVAGIVVSVSNNFSIAISLLNKQIGISSKLKRNNYFGSIKWDGRDSKKVILKEIPNHVNVEIGDTVVTSGYSAIFPEGVIIGTIEKYSEENGSNFYDITVGLTTSFEKITNVYVVGNYLRTEQEQLEISLKND